MRLFDLDFLSFSLSFYLAFSISLSISPLSSDKIALRFPLSSSHAVAVIHCHPTPVFRPHLSVAIIIITVAVIIIRSSTSAILSL